MVLERAEICIREGKIEEFLAVLESQALPLTTRFAGSRSFRALRGVDDVNSVMFLVEWESIEAHLASRAAPAHAEFRRIVVPYTSGAKPTVHFEPIGTGPSMPR